MINKDELKNALKLYLVTDSDILKGRDFYKCIEDADKIIVLDDGKISGVGTHEELLENNEIYADVYNSQVKGDDDEYEVAK